jgi:hypothetical protein
LAIAEYQARANGRDIGEEIGELYYNRMLRLIGIKAYDAQVAKLLGAPAVVWGCGVGTASRGVASDR